MLLLSSRLPLSAPRPTCRARLQCNSVSVGIDLGTTSSALAFIRPDGRPQILEDDMGKAIIPSVVSYHEDGSVSVGKAALLGDNTADSTFYSVKRVIGQRYKNVEHIVGKLSYTVAESEGGGVELQSSGQGSLPLRLSPQQVSSHILQHLLDRATRYFGHPVKQAVITIPAHFSHEQQEATKEAGRLAGLDKVLLLQEPVAAAMAHGFGKPTDCETILVFDLGGGTFDVSVLDSFEGIMEVLATGGDAELGGDDFTRALADVMTSLGSSSDAVPKLTDASNKSIILNQSDYRYRLFRAADEAKRQLSFEESVEAMLPSPCSSSSPASEPSTSARDSEAVALSRSEMELVWEPLMGKLWPPLAEVGKETFTQFDGLAPSCFDQSSLAQSASGLGLFKPSPVSKSSAPNKFSAPPRKLTGVVLVGAATGMPCVRRFITSVTGMQPVDGVDPEEVVALGAAVHAGVLQGNSNGLEMMDSAYVMDLQGRITGL